MRSHRIAFPRGCWTTGVAALRARWAAWRRGEPVRCALGGAIGVRVRATPIADNACAIYCMHCIACGSESPWFEADGDELRTVRDAPTNPRIPLAALVTMAE